MGAASKAGSGIGSLLALTGGVGALGTLAASASGDSAHVPRGC